MKNRVILLVTAALIVASVIGFFSYKAFKKAVPAQTVNADTATSAFQPPHTIDLPHADTSLIPFLSKALDEAFDASAKKDYNRLAFLIVYRGPDSLKFGMDVFDAKHIYDKNILRITADVFNKWNKDVDSRDYGRVFALPQPDGRSMPVMEVIFTSKKNFDRKFFGFLQIKDEWKIADVTSSL